MKKEEPTKSATSLFKRHKLRITPQRTAVWDFLCTTKSHPTADSVYRAIEPKFPNISFDTINRTLRTFADKGLAQTLPGDGDPRRYDADTRPHHHFRCMICGRVFDTFDPQLNTIGTPNDLPEFEILTRSILFRGYCPDCAPSTQQTQNKE